jgi:hypothetical protein
MKLTGQPAIAGVAYELGKAVSGVKLPAERIVSAYIFEQSYDAMDW